MHPLSANKKSRSISIDIARGLCIMCMVTVHAFDWWGKYRELNFYTGSFFLLFFFFSSGLCRSEVVQTKKYIVKQFFRLELPYMAFTAFYVVYICFIGKYFPDKSQGELAAMAIASWLYALSGVVEDRLFFHCSTFGIGPIWFLNCLFFSILIFLALQKIKWGYVLAFLLAGGAVISQHYICLPFAIQDALIGCAWIYAGFLLKKPVMKALKWLEEASIFMSVFFAGFFGTILYFSATYLPYQWINLGGNIYNPQSIISTAVGFCFVLSLSVFLMKVGILDDYFCYAGRKSFMILMIHNLDILLLRNWTHMGWYFLFFTLLFYPFVIQVSSRFWTKLLAVFHRETNQTETPAG